MCDRLDQTERAGVYKKANYKLKKCPSQAGYGTRDVCCPVVFKSIGFYQGSMNLKLNNMLRVFQKII